MVKNLPANAGLIRDSCSIPRSRRSSGVGNDYPLQYLCLENSMDRGAWWGEADKEHRELNSEFCGDLDVWEEIQEGGDMHVNIADSLAQQKHTAKHLYPNKKNHNSNSS